MLIIPCQERIFKNLKKSLTFILTCLDRHLVTVNVVEELTLESWISNLTIPPFQLNNPLGEVNRINITQ